MTSVPQRPDAKGDQPLCPRVLRREKAGTRVDSVSRGLLKHTWLILGDKLDEQNGDIQVIVRVSVKVAL